MSGPAAVEVSALTVVAPVVVEDEGENVWVIICVVVVTGATLVSIAVVVGLLVTVSVEAVTTGGVVEVEGEPVLTSSSGAVSRLVEGQALVVAGITTS